MFLNGVILMHPSFEQMMGSMLDGPRHEDLLAKETCCMHMDFLSIQTNR